MAGPDDGHGVWIESQGHGGACAIGGVDQRVPENVLMSEMDTVQTFKGEAQPVGRAGQCGGLAGHQHGLRGGSIPSFEAGSEDHPGSHGGLVQGEGVPGVEWRRRHRNVRNPRAAVRSGGLHSRAFPGSCAGERMGSPWNS